MSYETIVVGAGSAGAILATRLSEDPDRSVLLVEAGPHYASTRRLPDELRLVRETGEEFITRDHNWHFVARATGEAPAMAVPRGRVTGGSSAINSATFLRGVPEDYDSWASAGNGDWDYQSVLPFFRKIETDMDFRDDIHGRHGPIPVRRYQREEWNPVQRAFYYACRSRGFADCPDHNRPDSAGVGPLPANRNGRNRISTALGYLSKCRNRSNLQLMPCSTVHRVVFDGKRAVAVVIESGGELLTVQGEEIILCAGAIGSPQLLLLSGIGPSQDLSALGIPIIHELLGVGHNLRDHPACHVVGRAREKFPLDASVPKLQIGLRCTSVGSRLRNDMLIVALSFVMDPLSAVAERPAPIGVGMSCMLSLAQGSGKLCLQSRDPHVQPLLDYHFLEEPEDRRRMRDAIRLCAELAQHSEFNAIIAEIADPLDADLASDRELDSWLLRSVRTAHHISGTCKMGIASDSRAVVDPHGRVHGIEGLRVADASIMPDCVRAVINSTTMMIGERIADFIREGA